MIIKETYKTLIEVMVDEVYNVSIILSAYLGNFQIIVLEMVQIVRQVISLFWDLCSPVR